MDRGSGLILCSTAIAKKLSKSQFIPGDVYDKFNRLLDQVP